jgi:DNA (cytosine-5)-methyltransferase 1
MNPERETILAFSVRGRAGGVQAEAAPEGKSSTLRAGSGGPGRVFVALKRSKDDPPPEEVYQVRRLTPVECERLQGFPDGFTEVPYRKRTAADGPRYKALGNAMALPVMAWLLERVTRNMETGS